MAPDEAPAQEVPPSSRLCVKNIPKYVDEKKLREFFSAKGEVTDVKVLRTQDGRSRQLGFIGFKSVEDAAAALSYYNRSYMDTSKLEVEYARKVGDQQLPRAWSKHTKGSTANQKATQPAAGGKGDAAAPANAAGDAKKKGKDKGAPLPEDEDPKLREFLALMQPRTKARIWGNDEMPEGADGAAAAAAAAAATARQQQQQQRQRQQRVGSGDGDEDEDEDEDEYQDWSGAVARAHRAADEEEEEAEGNAGASDGEEEEEGGQEHGRGTKKKGGDEVVVNEAVSDLEYLRSRMRRWDEEDDEEEEVNEDRGGNKVGAEAAARGDQSGVGASPRCGAAEGATAGKATGRKAAAAGAGAGAAAAAAAKKGAVGTRKQQRDAADGGGSEDGGRDADMADADADGEDGNGSAAAAVAAGRAAGGQRGGAAAAAGGGEDDEEGEGIMDTGRLFVRNLAYTATEADLSDLFGAHGDLQEVHLVLDRETKRSKGLAYIQFQIPEDAVRAAQQLDGTIYQGRLLHILPAKRAPGSAAAAAAAAGGAASAGEGAAADAGAAGDDADGAAAAGGAPGGGLSAFKAQREAQRKADAGNRAAWNTLFMRADTVADAVAAHYGLSKAQLLDARTAAGGRGGGGAGDSVAVRMALGEAQVIAATKQALADGGVSVEALERAAAASGKASAVRSVARSSTTLLVKNLPYSADEDELLELFGRCGPVARLVVPPARALALVEFTEPQDARSAFRSLAYKKYHHVPLYLEWAPADVFSTPAPAQPAAKQQQQPDTAAAVAGKGTKGANAAALDAAADAAAAADGDSTAATINSTMVGTIYVKNLAFATTDAAFRKHFDGPVSAEGGCLHSAVVARKKAKDGAVQSLGYGFVEVDSEAMAAAVIKRLQGSQLDGHKLALQLSRARKAAAGAAGATHGSSKSKSGETEGSTKLVVRNLAFEATKKDIQGMFNPFGHLKSCRLPKKFDGSHRGFAFVEFVTKQEARNAFEGAGGTHLYGRRLVVEYAKEDDGLDEIRNKTAAKFKRDEEMEEGAAPAKRLKL